jgi:hypothetical protein
VTFPTGDANADANAGANAGAGDEEIYYVAPSTYERLVAQNRVGIYDFSGAVRLRFGSHDPLYPNIPVEQSPQVMQNSVHRRAWDTYGERFIFEYVADV